SSFTPGFFVLLGIPGPEKVPIWIGVPLFIICSVLLIYLIIVECSLHAPMFFFLSMLASTDLTLCNTSAPKTFIIFRLGPWQVTFSGCFAQMFFLHSSFAMDFAILLAMAFDGYTAVCFPPRHSIVVTHQTVTQIVVAVISRGVCVIFPRVFLLKRLPFCRTIIVHHTYCEHIGIARLAGVDISINIWYGFAVPVMTVTSDLILIGLSCVLIPRAVFKLPSRDARQKALSTCGFRVCVILTFYTPAMFSVLAHRFGHNVPLSFHTLFANLFVAVPPVVNPITYGVKSKPVRDRTNLLFFPNGK
uniref:Olfactory receptor family 52 subfamily H member 7 n=1 Tax=Jaculus jaculus TaxID=51337 RepID=A0A8C5L004_JACJA